MLNEKIKINYIETIDNDTFKINYYESEYYGIKEKIYYNEDKEICFRRIAISGKCRDTQVIEDVEKDDEIVGFRIQTTAYGSLDKEGIQELINEYQIAIETVEQLEKIFLK